MPTPRVNLGVAVLNDTLYTVAGFADGVGNVATVEVYDPSTDTWSAKASMPIAQQLVRVAAINGVLYAVGGFFSYPPYFTSALVAYNPSTDTWTTKAPMSGARDALGVGVVNGILYAVGGLDTCCALTTVEAYHP